MYRFAAATVALLLLAGCTSTATADPTTTLSAAPSGTPSATASTSPSATSTPTPTPSDDATAAVSDLVLTARSVVAKTSTGHVVSTSKFLDEPARVLKRLTAAFGSAPKKTTTKYDRTYVWGGFTMRVSRASRAGWSAEDLKLYPRIFVYTTGKTVGDVQLHTVDGISVGDSAKEIAAEYPKAVEYDKDPQTGKKRLQLYLNKYQVGTSSSGGALTQSVWATTDSPTGKIVDIRTPSPNYGE